MGIFVFTLQKKASSSGPEQGLAREAAMSQNETQSLVSVNNSSPLAQPVPALASSLDF